MKKISGIFFCFLFFVSLLTLPAFGEGKGKIALSGEVEALNRSDPFELFLELNRNPGVTTLLVTVHFDPQVLEVQNVIDLELLPGFSADDPTPEGDLVLRWKSPETSSDLDSAGELCKIVFRVKDDAPLGETVLEPRVSERFFDAQNSKGEAVPFDTQALTAYLPCYHVKQELRVLSQPSFELAGIGTLHCLDCGESWEEQVLPTLISADGMTVGTLQPGEYLETDRKGLRTDYLYGGAQVEEAKALFGDSLIRSFQVSFTKNDSIFVPEGDTPVSLALEFDLPETFYLYVLRDGGAQQVEAKLEKGSLQFSHASGLFVLASRKLGTMPEATSATTTTTLSPVDSSPVSESSRLSPEEEAMRQDVKYLVLGGVAVLVFGTGAVILIRRKQRF